MSGNENQSQVAIPTTTTTDEPKDQVPVLNIDCLEELFEWMTFADLLAFRLGCKRFKKAVDYYIKSYYPAIGKIEITDKNFACFLRIEPDCIKLVKGVRFTIKTSVTSSLIECIKDILNQLEDIRITNLKLQGDFYEDFLKWCPNLRYLSIQYFDALKLGTDNGWLTRQYPTLQHIHFDDKVYGVKEIAELPTFFKLNPQIRTLSVTIYFLLKHTNLLCEAKITFDQLIVGVDSFFEDEMPCVCDLLKRLHHYGFYKRVHIRGFFFACAQDDVNLFGTIPALEKLSLFNRESAIPALPDLKELRFTLSGIPPELENATSNLKHIERIYFEKAPFDSVLLIIQHFLKVNLIKADDIEDGMHFKNNILDLNAINKKRQKLNAACKITFYVADTIYLATKFAKMSTCFSLIELKRSETHKWEHYYY